VTALLDAHSELDRENVGCYGGSYAGFTTMSLLTGTDNFADEGHGISGSWENRVAHRTMMLEYFERWLRDRPAAWEARWQE